MEKNLEEKRHLDILIATGAIYRNGFENIFKEYDGKIVRPNKTTPKRKIWVDIIWSIFFWGTIIIPILI